MNPNNKPVAEESLSARSGAGVDVLCQPLAAISTQAPVSSRSRSGAFEGPGESIQTADRSSMEY